MSSLHRFLRFFFWHFYHGFAWTYDAVAAMVSLGRWNDWLECAIPYLQGPRVLEIGHGPGHLQLALRSTAGIQSTGLDESRQMGQMARRRLKRAGYRDASLARGQGQALPFESESFDTVVATFPTEYIFEPGTLLEVRRVLRRAGRFVIIPAAWIVGRQAMDRAAAWLFRVTDQAPSQPAERLPEKFNPDFVQAGFSVEYHMVEIRSSSVLVMVATIATADKSEDA